jgi:hypothetical protein
LRTAVQLRRAEPTSELIYGAPGALGVPSYGDVALFDAGQIVAYFIRYAAVRRLFLFRTLEKDEPGAASLPGVWPRVRLLADLSTERAADRARRLFLALRRRRQQPSLLSDQFWLRVSHLLARRARHPKLMAFCLRLATADIYDRRFRPLSRGLSSS